MLAGCTHVQWLEVAPLLPSATLQVPCSTRLVTIPRGTTVNISDCDNNNERHPAGTDVSCVGIKTLNDRTCGLRVERVFDASPRDFALVQTLDAMSGTDWQVTVVDSAIHGITTAMSMRITESDRTVANFSLTLQNATVTAVASSLVDVDSVAASVYFQVQSGTVSNVQLSAGNGSVVSADRNSHPGVSAVALSIATVWGNSPELSLHDASITVVDSSIFAGQVGDIDQLAAAASVACVCSGPSSSSILAATGVAIAVLSTRANAMVVLAGDKDAGRTNGLSAAAAVTAYSLGGATRFWLSNVSIAVDGRDSLLLLATADQAAVAGGFLIQAGSDVPNAMLDSVSTAIVGANVTVSASIGLVSLGGFATKVNGSGSVHVTVTNADFACRNLIVNATANHGAAVGGIAVTSSEGALIVAFENITCNIIEGTHAITSGQGVAAAAVVVWQYMTVKQIDVLTISNIFGISRSSISITVMSCTAAAGFLVNGLNVYAASFDDVYSSVNHSTVMVIAKNETGNVAISASLVRSGNLLAVSPVRMTHVIYDSSITARSGENIATASLLFHAVTGFFSTVTNASFVVLGGNVTVESTAASAVAGAYGKLLQQLNLVFINCRFQVTQGAIVNVTALDAVVAGFIAKSSVYAAYSFDNVNPTFYVSQSFVTIAASAIAVVAGAGIIASEDNTQANLALQNGRGLVTDSRVAVSKCLQGAAVAGIVAYGKNTQISTSFITFAVNASEVTLSQVSNAAIAGVSGITSAFADASTLTISDTSLLLRDATIRGDCVRACAVAGIAHYNPNDATQVDMTDTAFGSEASSVSLVTAEVTSVVGVATSCVKTCYVNLARFALTLRGTTVELVASNPSDGVSIAIGGITSFTTSSSAIGARVTAAVGYITVKESTIVASTFLGAVATAGFAMASTAGPSQANSITNVSVTLYKATAFANASGGGVAVAGASARTPNAVQLTSNDNAFVAIGSNLTLGGSGAAALGVSHTGTTNWLLESGNTFAACASTVQAIVTPADSSMVVLGVMSIPPRPVLGRTSNLVALNSNFTSPDANLRILSGLHPNEKIPRTETTSGPSNTFGAWQPT
jgi:hypothetical protein